jgi:MinD-like ATPase involved in chromosome partitioning or flagellar assembly
LSKETSTVPQWPTITAHVESDGSGEVSLSPSTKQPIQEDTVEDARAIVLEHVAAFARENHRRAVRLRVRDPEGEWVLGVNPDGTGFPLDDDREVQGVAVDTAAALGASNGGPVSEPAGPQRMQTGSDDHGTQPQRSGNGVPAAVSSGPAPPLAATRSCAGVPATSPGPEFQIGPMSRHVDRKALHSRPPGRLARLMSSVNERLKDPAEREEEELDRHFARRYLVTDTNLPVVVSPKGGSGKTTVALILGDALASRMPNQRVAAIDFNPGGGALEAVATEDRSARFSMLQLHRDRKEVRSHAQLQPYVASLHSGLDVLAVEPDMGLALTIKPHHYEELFDEVLVPSYNLLVLDTSPDIASPVTQLALQRGTQMIIVLEQGYVSSGVVTRSLPYLLEQPAAGGDGSRAIVVINRVINDSRAGALDVLREEIRRVHAGPIVEIPWDLDLRADIDSGEYTLDGVKRRATRLPLKRLALHVAENFV